MGTMLANFIFGMVAFAAGDKYLAMALARSLPAVGLRPEVSFYLLDVAIPLALLAWGFLSGSRRKKMHRLSLALGYLAALGLYLLTFR